MNSLRQSLAVLGLIAVIAGMALLILPRTPEGYDQIDGKLVKQGREYDESYLELETSCPYKRGTRRNGAEILFCLHPVDVQSGPDYQVCPRRSGVKPNDQFVALMQRKDTYVTFGDENRSQQVLSANLITGFCTEFRGPALDGADIVVRTPSDNWTHLVVWRGNPYPEINQKL